MTKLFVIVAMAIGLTACENPMVAYNAAIERNYQFSIDAYQQEANEAIKDFQARKISAPELDARMASAQNRFLSTEQARQASEDRVTAIINQPSMRCQTVLNGPVADTYCH